jgi:hypothetical protein
MSNIYTRPARDTNKTTPLSSYIQKRLDHADMTWAQLMRSAKMPKTNQTRIRRKGWIPNTDECTRLAAAMGAPWEDLWIAAGHIKKEQVEAIRGNVHSYSYLWRLTPEEAQIIGAYRACVQDSRDFLLAAVRGVARANEHEWNDDIRVASTRTELALDFVNAPDYVAPLYADTSMPNIKELMRKIPDRKVVDLPYAAQSAIVGILRYVTTGRMSPLPKWLFSNRPDLQQFEEVEQYKDFTAMEQETDRQQMQDEMDRRVGRRIMEGETFSGADRPVRMNPDGSIHRDD